MKRTLWVVLGTLAVGAAVIGALFAVIAYTRETPATLDRTATTSTSGPDAEQPVFERIAVEVPSGWKVLTATEGDVVLGNGAAEYRVLAKQVGSDAETLVDNWVADPGKMQQYTITGKYDLGVPTSAVASAAGATWNGQYVTDEGSLPVEGIVISYVTEDGIGVLVESINAMGDFDSPSGAYNVMLMSIIDDL